MTLETILLTALRVHFSQLTKMMILLKGVY